MEIYDYVIIGGGISGLYANYLLSQKYKTILLESNNELGGRAIEKMFHGKLIKTGAGIVTTENIHLLNLLKSLNIKYSSNISGIEKLYNYDNFDMNNAVKLVKEKYEQLVKENNIDIYKLNVKQFILKYFGKEFTYNYIKNSEFYDYLKCDLTYYVKYYNIEESKHIPHIKYYLSWNELINKLKLDNCITNYRVDKIIKYNNIYNDTNDSHNTFLINNQIYAKNIIFALTLKPLQKLLNNIIKINLNKYIYSVPFCRIYTYHKDELPPIVKNKYFIVNNELQKIIYINEHIMMISYNDSNNYTYWKKNLNNINKIQKLKLINSKIRELNINIPKASDLDVELWNEGVHYFKPNKNVNKVINKLSNPTDGVYIVGEILSFKQGWVEGCIESVDRLYNKIISQDIYV